MVTDGPSSPANLPKNSPPVSASGFTGDKEGIQQALGGLMGKQPVAKIVQEGEIEPWVGQFKAEGIFPIDTAADGIRRLTIGEPFDILHDHHERQAPGRHFHRPSLGWIQIGKELIIVEGAELGAQSHVKVPFGERGPKLVTTSWLIVAFGDIVEEVKLTILRRSHIREWLDNN
jgi:hypothetical protein